MIRHYYPYHIYSWTENPLEFFSVDVSNIISIIIDETYKILYELEQYEGKQQLVPFWINHRTSLTHFVYNSLYDYGCRKLMQNELTYKGRWILYMLKNKLISQKNLDLIALSLFDWKSITKIIIERSTKC